MREREEHFIQNCFDRAFTTVDDERVNTIMAGMKSKQPKWDIKEKCRKMEQVVRELKECLTIYSSETKGLKESCVDHDIQTNKLLKDCAEKIATWHGDIKVFRASETKMIAELKEVQNNNTVLKSEFEVYKALNGPKLLEVDAAKRQLDDATDRLYKEEMRSIQLKAETDRCQRECAEMKGKFEETLRVQKEQLEQKTESTLAAQRDELASLRAELNRRQTDMERTTSEKAEQDRSKSTLSEELITAKSALREAEGDLKRGEMEIARLTAELVDMKGQVAQKDADLRSTLSSLKDVQKEASEDKASLRNEISVLQTRAQFLEEERLSTTSQLAAKKEECNALLRDVAQKESAFAVLEGKFSERDREASLNAEAAGKVDSMKELLQKAEYRENCATTERIAADSALRAIQSEHNAQRRALEERFNATIDQLRVEISAVNAQRAEAAEEIHKMSDMIVTLENQIREQHKALENTAHNPKAVEELGALKGELDNARNRMAEMQLKSDSSLKSDQERIKTLEAEVRAGEIARRKLHNQVQELRGNIRVFARVRPFLPNDGFNMDALPDSAVRCDQTLNTLSVLDRGTHNNFNFDRVFGQGVSQEAMFSEVSEFVQSALDGYNVCLFSYGQTGSGKTHTMQGSGTDTMRGIIPRAMEQVGLYKTELEGKGWKYSMEVSFVEIYNDDIRDLMRDEKGVEIKHEVRKDASGAVFVSDVKMIAVDPNHTAEIENIMERAGRMRSVGATKMNEASSRSHSIFALHLKATSPQGTVLKGTLNLVDLAGSEKTNKSGTTGSALAESNAINTSLTHLSNVFRCIAAKQTHIPFRNCTLTQLLAPSLSADGKTLMVVNLSPTDDSIPETLSSLRLAKDVNSCEMGKPKKQLQVQDKTSKANTSSNNLLAAASASSSSTPMQGVSTSSTPSRVRPVVAEKTLSASLKLGHALSGAVSQPLSSSMGAKKTPLSALGVSGNVVEKTLSASLNLNHAPGDSGKLADETQSKSLFRSDMNGALDDRVDSKEDK
eukprot:gene27259-33953_t